MSEASWGHFRQGGGPTNASVGDPTHPAITPVSARHDPQRSRRTRESQPEEQTLECKLWTPGSIAMNPADRSRLTRGAFLTAGVALLAGCGRDHGVSWPAAGTTPVTPPAPHMSATPLAATEGATKIDGTPFSADVLAGRPVVLWFWAPWCFVCRSEAPNVNIAVHHEAGLATFVGVAGLGQEGDMRSFVRSTHTEGMVHLADTTGSIWNAFGIVAQPSFAFITADRRVSTYTGSLGASNLIDKVDALLGA